MRALILLVTTALMGATTLTHATPSHNSLLTLGSAFKSYSTIAPKVDAHDITMGYTGQDLSHKLNIARPINVA
jgi:hypothetical protein